MPALTSLDRFRGCLLGHAIGDALGAPFATNLLSLLENGERGRSHVDALARGLRAGLRGARRVGRSLT